MLFLLRLILIIWLITALPKIFLRIMQWIVNNKAGKPGWHVLIPFLRTYTRAKFGGTVKYFWVFSICYLIAGAILNVSDIPIILTIVGLVLAIVAFVAYVQVEHGVARVFGKTNGFGVGLVFLPFIFYPILALGNSQYNPELIDITRE